MIPYVAIQPVFLFLRFTSIFSLIFPWIIFPLLLVKRFFVFVIPELFGKLRVLSFVFRGPIGRLWLQLTFVLESFWRFIKLLLFVLLLIYVFFFRVIHSRLSFFVVARSFVLGIMHDCSLLLQALLSYFHAMQRFERIFIFPVFLSPKLIAKFSLFQLVDFWALTTLYWVVLFELIRQLPIREPFVSFFIHAEPSLPLVGPFIYGLFIQLPVFTFTQPLFFCFILEFFLRPIWLLVLFLFFIVRYVPILL